MGLGDMIHKRRGSLQPETVTPVGGKLFGICSERPAPGSTVAPATGIVAPCGTRDALPIVVANTVTGSTNSLYRISGRDAPSSPGEIRIRAVSMCASCYYKSQAPTNFTGHSQFVAPPKKRRFGTTFLLVVMHKSRLERVS
jgi:hypothetical protein